LLEFKKAIAFPNDPLLIRRLRKSSVNFIPSEFTSLDFKIANFEQLSEFKSKKSLYF